MSFVSELKRRKVFQVAAVYLVVAWLIMQVVDVVNEPLRLPEWFATVAILLLAIGFPIAVIVSWAFDLTPDGVVRDEGVSNPSGGRTIEYVLAGLLVMSVGWSVWSFSSSGPGANRAAGPPVVILMDTPAPQGVYDPETRSASGTNADDLSDALRDFPVVLHKETVNSTWDGEDQLLKQGPALILIHRSAFFHSIAQEFGSVYPTDPGYYQENTRRLYAVADNKLVAFFGYFGLGSPNTRFLVYSRGAVPGWAEESVRYDWVTEIERRFPSLTGRIFTINVPGGVENATFRDDTTVRMVRRNVQSILELPDGD